MTRFQINEDNRTANAAQHATELVSANQANATMESQMQTLLSQVHSLQLSNTHGNQTNNGKFSNTDAVADAVAELEAVQVGEPNKDMDADDNQF